MKILVVVHGFPPNAQGGSEIYAHNHAVAMCRQFGDDVVVLTRDADSDRPEYDVRRERRDGLTVVRINNTFRHLRSFEDSYANAELGGIADTVIDEVRPDVAHIHHLTCLSTAVVGSLNARGVPAILTLHDYWLMCHRGQLLDVDNTVCEGPDPDACRKCLGSVAGGRAAYAGAAAIHSIERHLPTPLASGLRRTARAVASRVFSSASDPAQVRLDHMRALCGQIAHFIAPSRYMRDRFVRFGIHPDRITVAGYGFDAEAFHRPARAGAHRLRVGFFGSLMVSKAPHLLLEAVELLPAEAVSVDLFGEFVPYHGDFGYRDTIDRLIARSSARCHGRIAHADVPRALDAIDVLVVPSMWPENSPLVIQEAFLAGVPVIAARIGGIPEAVEHDRNGLLFEPGDPADLARSIKRLIDEPSLLDRLRAGLPRVRTIADDVSETRQIYMEQRHGDRGSATPVRLRRLAAIVLNFRTADDTVLAVRSLMASNRQIDDIIVVDNDSADEGLRRSLRSVIDRIVLIATGKNLGFSGGMNVGILAALERGAERVLLVNSDAIVPPDCVRALETSLDGHPGAGIAGPVIAQRSQPDRVESLGLSYSEATGRMRQIGFGAILSERARPRDAVVDAVSGCVMLIDRKVIDAAGLLDEDYFFGFEDLDFCSRARRAGFKTVLAGNAAAFHHGARAIGSRASRRLYYAARNHLLFARRSTTNHRSFESGLRTSTIVLLNLAHAIRSNGGCLSDRVTAVVQGTRDYLAGRFGP